MRPFSLALVALCCILGSHVTSGQPVITGVRGCGGAQGGTAVGCVAGKQLTVTGSNFPAGVQLYVDGSTPLTGVRQANSTTLYGDLPWLLTREWLHAITAGNNSSGGGGGGGGDSTSNAYPVLYAATTPIVNSANGCRSGISLQNVGGTLGCVSGDILTLYGTQLSSATAVTVAGARCDLWQKSDRELGCILPALPNSLKSQWLAVVVLTANSDVYSDAKQFVWYGDRIVPSSGGGGTCGGLSTGRMAGLVAAAFVAVVVLLQLAQAAYFVRRAGGVKAFPLLVKLRSGRCCCSKRTSLAADVEGEGEGEGAGEGALHGMRQPMLAHNHGQQPAVQLQQSQPQPQLVPYHHPAPYQPAAFHQPSYDGERTEHTSTITAAAPHSAYPALPAADAAASANHSPSAPYIYPRSLFPSPEHLQPMA